MWSRRWPPPAIYTALRYPAIDAVGADEFTGLIASRAAAYLIFGAVGGWAIQVLEGSLEKLELYDEIDDETGLYNARHLLQQTDLEAARARRYQTLFSAVELDFPAAPLNALKARQRRTVLRDLGRQLREGARNVDHVDPRPRRHHPPPGGHPPGDGGRGRRGVPGPLRGAGQRRSSPTAAPPSTPPRVQSRSVTFPGDEEGLEALRAEFQRIDALQHR